MSASAPVAAPIAIVGMACLFPKAGSLGMYWGNIKRGVDGIGPIPDTHWKPEDYFDADPKKPDHTYAKRGGFLEPVAFDPAAYGIAPNALEATDAAQLLGLVVASEALRSAGYAPESTGWDRGRTSVVLGVTGTLQLVIPLGARLGHPQWRKALADAGVPADVAEDVVARIADTYVPWQEASFPGLLGNVVAGRIANRLDLGGTNCVVDAACASSLSAVHLAALELEAGKSDMVVTGGVDAFNDIFMYMCFSKTPALSATGDARPYDADGDGTCLGEGVGMVVLKRLADAERDGDPIFAVLRGVGTASDGRGKAIYAPDDDGQRRCLEAAYRAAGVEPASVDLLEGHGTGTKVGDAIEVTALHRVYGQAPEGGAWCALGSVKSQIGHTKAAAGAAGLIKAALALHHKVLPPTIKLSKPLAQLGEPTTPFYFNDRPRPWVRRAGQPRRAAVSSFGFGGSNFHVVLEEHGAAKAVVDWDGKAELVAIGAASADALLARLARYEGLAGDALRLAAGEDRAAFRPSAAHRLAFVIEDGVLDVAALRARVAEGAPFTTPDGAAYGVGACEGGLAALFPGQGAQYPGMGRDLACTFPAALDALEGMSGAFGGRLVDFMIPPRAFGDAAVAVQVDRLRATDVAQPALGAVELGAWQVLQGFGVQPAAAAGHSYGELAALCAAGRLGISDFMALSALRGRLMAGDGGDRGSMLAVSAGADAVAEGLDAELVIANKNTPAQVVVAGPTAAIERQAAAFAARGVRAVRLQVGAAFHSPLVAAAEAGLADGLAEVAFAAGDFPVYANTTADVYPADVAACRALLAGQLARPVEWVAQVEALYAAGLRTFLEIGPGAKVGGMVKAILGDRAHAVVAVDASNGKRDGVTDLARALAVLAARGHAIDLTSWGGGEAVLAPIRAKKPPKMAVPISGANHRSSRPSRPAATRKLAEVMQSSNGVQKMAGSNGNGNGHHPVTPPAPVAPVVVAPTVVEPVVQAVAPAVWQEAVQAAGQTLAAWQRMQEQTAALHRTFLEGQQSAQNAFQQLIEHQRTLLDRAGTLPVAALPAPLPAAPAPVATRASVAERSEASPPASAGYVPAPPAVVAPPARAALPPVALAAEEGARAVERTEKVVASAAVQAPSADALPVLMAVVAEKTGYPVETLAPDMALEADLGIDSIKRVEIMSALADRLPTAPVLRPDQLGTLLTLAEVAAALSPAGAPVAAPVAALVVAASGAVEAAIVAVVAEKTGYPPETLDLDMALEADLGIDSIKRVEIMSALADRLPGVPALAPDALGAAATLRAIATLLAGAAPDGRLDQTPSPAPAGHPLPGGEGDVTRVLLAVIADKTGYPPETLELDMALEGDLGIDSIKRVEILSALAERLPGAAPIGPDRAGSLLTLRDVAAALGTVAPAAAPAAAPGVDVAAVVLAVVAEKTGYPAETLEPGMALEADLGIDSIKRVEILSTLTERLPGAPVPRPEALGALATLADVIATLGAAPVAPPARAALPPVVEVVSVPPAVTAAEAPVAEGTEASPTVSTGQTGTPDDPATTHDLIVDLPVPTALGEGVLRPTPKVPFGADIRVAALTDDALGAAIAARLTALGFKATPVDLTTDPLDAPLAGLVVVGPAGVGPDWDETDETALKAAFRHVQAAGPALRAAAERGGAWLATVGRLDGAFGCADPAAAFNPAAGALAGLAKTAGLEWPEVACQALDLHPAWSCEEAAAAFAAELFLDGPAEIGLGPAGRAGLILEPAGPAPAGPAPLAAGDLVVVSGGARGVTAEVAIALARTYRPAVALLGRTPLPAAEPAWLAAATDEAAVKAAIARETSPPPAPRELEARWKAIAAAREVRATLARLEALGATARYVAVDVRDPAAMAGAIAELEATHGPVRGLVHGAGVLADKFIADKTQAQFDGVFDTKIAGLRALLGAVDQALLKAVVLFSSVTARRGRVGQADYAMANELLNKAARRLAAAHPACRVLAVDWGPWDGGMVTPALKKVFAAEGVGVVPLAGGAAWLADELGLARPGATELVVLGKPAGVAPPPPPPPPVQAAVAAPAPKLRTAFKRDLAVRTHPFLASHVMGGKAVLPVAVIVEWMAHAALHANPGLQFRGLDDFAVLKGVILDDEGAAIRLDAGPAQARGGEPQAAVELRSEGRDMPNARGTVVLAEGPARAPQGHWSEGWAGGSGAGRYALGIQEAYRTILFHGPEFRGITQVEAIGPEGIVGRVKAARAPQAWLTAPLRDAWIADPLALDAAFQLLILWSVETLGAPCLPCRAAAYRQYAPFPADGTRVLAKVVEKRSGTAIADVAFLDAEGLLVAELRGAECAFDPSLTEAFKRNQLAGAPAPLA